MKKLFTLSLSFLLAAVANASVSTDVVFADADGNVYADGEVLVITDVEENIMGEASGDNTYQINSGLYVYNTSESVQQVGLKYTVEEISRGSHSCCFPTLCVTMTSTGSFETDHTTMKAGATKDMITEWYTAGEGNCTATYTLQLYSYDSSTKSYTYLGEGNTITVQYVYSSSTGIKTVSADSGVLSTEYYDITGRKTSNPSHGVFIKKTRLADGTTKAQKIILK